MRLRFKVKLGLNRGGESSKFSLITLIVLKFLVILKPQLFRAVSSVVERHVYTVLVGGSNPSLPRSLSDCVLRKILRKVYTEVYTGGENWVVFSDVKSSQ